MKTQAWISTRGVAGVAAVALTFGGTAFADRYAAIVVDGATNEVLHEDAADAQRYPASLTKMMTLYLLFEELEKGHVKLNDTIFISKRAERRPPSKLGVKAGDRVLVEDAIYALVTRSANDVATAVAEHIGGSEQRFAARMTARARQLGMTSTRYMNASGLPDPGQVTTARDTVLLSQALIRDFPQYYAYFRTPDFSWRRVYSRNHNNLLGQVDGVDGIKTGYTQKSGFNLASSAVRDGHRLYVVVLGGETSAARDAQVAYLMESAYETIKSRGRAPEAPEIAYTALPVTRATLPQPAQQAAQQPAPAPAAQEPTANASVTPYPLQATVEEGDADVPMYVVPVPFPRRAN